MRIIAGEWRGRRLTPLGKGDDSAHLRPTPDRVRESLFSMLTAQDVIAGARVLDLFAGTGALGLEALSRGADTATFIENGRVGARLVAENIRVLDAKAALQSMDATRLPRNAAPPFTLVFLDPPYGKGLGDRALRSAQEGNWLAPDCTIVWEESAAMPPPPGFQKTDQRRFGETWITLLTPT